MSYDFDVAHDDFESQVRSVYPRAGDGLLNFLVQQKIKDRDVSLCPRCNAVFDAEAAEIFEKERMKKELMEKGKAIAHSSGVDEGKEVDVDEEYFEEGDDDMVGMISIIPTDYLGEYEGDPEEDCDVEAEEAFSFIRYEDESGYFLRPTKKQKSHLRPLHITTTLSGIKVSKVLIDGGATISLLPERMTLNSYNCEGCYLSSEGLTMKLHYPQLNFCHGFHFSSLCNPSDVSNHTADVVVEVHGIENEFNVRFLTNLLSHIPTLIEITKWAPRRIIQDRWLSFDNILTKAIMI
ncbi:hypothetical protein Ahy_B02g060739 [Arachis hypogaea]|uniref:Uncharacterized protein n=1 Tax=Arachis hypogaea TaxID=3818 RepID=A0A445AJ81_ARAHY|nr:hypothetical protein Ahy_B02g060739 [Arachis hypogaea]